MLTIVEIKAMKPGQWRSDGAARGQGALTFHCSSSGQLSAYFRHTLPTGKRYDLPLGLFDESGRKGATLASLRKRAGELSRLYQSGIRDLKAHFEAEKRRQAEEEARRQAEEEAQRAAEAAAREVARREREERQRFNLAALLRAYCDHLEQKGKYQSAQDARSVFRVNILRPAPDLAATPAREVTASALAARIRATRESGRERAAGKLRGYLFAAYSLATRAEFDTEAPSALIPFRIAHNPLVAIPNIPTRPGNRVLSRDELRALVGKLGDDLTDAALRLCLFAGGQRASQVLRARASDFDEAAGVLRLLDPKGRRAQPREHRLPLGPVAADLCKALVARAREVRPEETDPPLFAASPRAVLSLKSLTGRVSELSTDLGGPAFSFSDLRRTAETEMAALGFSTDLRAQVMSHGLSGVQEKHYNRHDFMQEKAAALVKWEAHLEGREQPAKVIPMRRRAKG